MISHKYKCIFIHIPRVAGSSIESKIIGKNWWSIEKETKHILASQAKYLYKDYWNSYFKFSFVRNPFDRMVSMIKFGGFFYGRNTSILNTEAIEWYKDKFGFPVTVEYDYRFYKNSEIRLDRHVANSVYSNILDEELDFIGKYENLDSDFEFVCKQIGYEYDGLPDAGASASADRKPLSFYYKDKNLVQQVASLYMKDFDIYGYNSDPLILS